MESVIVGLEILPFAFLDHVQKLPSLAILRDSLRIPLQTLVIFALVTLDYLSFLGHSSLLTR
jgi:hypothetical protein